MTRLLRRCCEDPEPVARPATVAKFRKHPARPRSIRASPETRRSDPQPLTPARPSGSDVDAVDLPLPLIPPGLNEGFGLW